MEGDSRRFLPQRSGALRKGATLPPPGRSSEPTEEQRSDANETDEDAARDIRRRRGLSLPPTSTQAGARNAMICPPIYDNNLTEDGYCDDDSYYDDFTDDDDDDEIIYENPVFTIFSMGIVIVERHYIVVFSQANLVS